MPKEDQPAASDNRGAQRPSSYGQSVRNGCSLPCTTYQPETAASESSPSDEEMTSNDTTLASRQPPWPLQSATKVWSPPIRNPYASASPAATSCNGKKKRWPGAESQDTRPDPAILVLEKPYQRRSVAPAKSSCTNDVPPAAAHEPNNRELQVIALKNSKLTVRSPVAGDQSEPSSSSSTPHRPTTSNVAHSLLRNPYKPRVDTAPTLNAAATSSDIVLRNPYRKSATIAPNRYSVKRPLWDGGKGKALRTAPSIDPVVASKSTANEALPSIDRSAEPSECASALIISAADKAGMDGIDRAAIDAIILQVSGNSAYMQQQRKRDAVVNEKIAALRAKLVQRPQQSLPPLPQQHQFQNWINARSPRSVTVVVDMDMFYMACELLHRPDIAPTTPAAVGGSSMILTSNYAARRFGVRSAMPGYIGTALVERLSKGKEQLVFCPSNFDLYKRQSSIVEKTLREYDPRRLSMLSLDEASLDISQYLLGRLQHPEWTHQQIASHLLEGKDSPDEQLLSYSNEDCLREAAQIVAEMRSAVVRATGGLTCSAGVAPNRLLAKIASDRHKPNGQCIVGPSQGEVTDFLHPLPIRKVSGIGRVTEKLLKAFGVTTVLQLYEQRNLVSFLFEPTSKITQFLLQASIGCSASDGTKDDGSGSNHKHQQKGISRSRTFQSIPWSDVANKIEDIGSMLADDMQRKNIKAKTVSLHVKFDTYATLSRAKTLASPVWTATDLIRVAVELKTDMGSQPHQVRLVGISCSNLQDPTAPNQSTMDRFLVAQEEGAARPPVERELPPGVDAPQGNPYLSPKVPDVTNTARTNAAAAAVPCPVCQHLFPSESAVGAHIDGCLNGAVVRKLVQEENSNQKSQSRKKRKTTLMNYFSQSLQPSTRETL